MCFVGFHKRYTMAKEMITGAEALMRSLKAEGVSTIFGYPGGSIMPVYDALYDYTRGEKKAFEYVMSRRQHMRHKALRELVERLECAL